MSNLMLYSCRAVIYVFFPIWLFRLSDL